MTPCILIAFFYLKIYLYAIKAKFRTQNTPKLQRDLKSSFRIAKGLFLSYFLFTICWMPYGLIVMIDFSDQLPRTAHMYPLLLAHLNSSLNPILYALTNSNFQRGYKNLFYCIFKRKKYTYSIKGNESR